MTGIDDFTPAGQMSNMMDSMINMVMQLVTMMIPIAVIILIGVLVYKAITSPGGQKALSRIGS